MASIRSSLPLRSFFHAYPLPVIGPRVLSLRQSRAEILYGRIRCVASESSDGGQKVSARLSMMQQVLQEAEERARYAGSEKTPKVTLGVNNVMQRILNCQGASRTFYDDWYILVIGEHIWVLSIPFKHKDSSQPVMPAMEVHLSSDHVTVNFARSGGPGGQNVNKVNTKVDMRFNVKNAHWLGERTREKILQMEKNRINKDGDLVISSTKTRTQKGNIEDALAKLQEIIDSASYVPPPPSEEQKKRIQKLAAIEEQKRMQTKRALSQKKAIRRTKDSWD